MIRCAETGREQQARFGKLRRDLASVIAERLPGAHVEMAPGRVIVDTHDDAAELLAALPGVGTVSPCERVAFGELEAAAVALARRSVRAAGTFAVRVRRGGEKTGASAHERRPEITRRLADAIVVATHARIDLTSPDVEIGVELRGDEAFIFDRIVDGIDRTGPAAPRSAGDARFLADQMLGRLAARLRLLGYDTLTVFDIADSEVTRLAAAEGRILLTRDGPLAQTRAVPVYRVDATDPREQLTEVVDAFSLAPDPARYFTRCALCNTPVESVDEAAVRDRLPSAVRDRGLELFRCAPCDRLYWRGTHVERILDELAE